jgi:hypothetical protein
VPLCEIFCFLVPLPSFHLFRISFTITVCQ